MSRLRRTLAAFLEPRTARSDRGSAATEYVLILAIVIAIAVGVGAILTPRILNSAQSIDLGVNP
ncbi:hypothetical protein ACOQFV_07675 [Nocardiopsis changdeensis]|uniref:Flp family type IVb pilin n=1 Tax=Nocardiopsis changdeensis TaxID=2831969 RepID=A0ABX8BHX4_9ACTN|nr:MULTISPECIES: hypothetical protein [Nocardiopsis]QUX20556.1 hypothetical protein KGD84_18790 [Nocardiopsis changdeensis]QYX36487.1 hypothetical protein K1J57_28245 [Nocardiopsis sp. MT53]